MDTTPKDGTRVRLIADHYFVDVIKKGTIGTVVHVESIQTFFRVRWDQPQNWKDCGLWTAAHEVEPLSVLELVAEELNSQRPKELRS